MMKWKIPTILFKKYVLCNAGCTLHNFGHFNMKEDYSSWGTTRNLKPRLPSLHCCPTLWIIVPLMKCSRPSPEHHEQGGANSDSDLHRRAIVFHTVATAVDLLSVPYSPLCERTDPGMSFCRLWPHETLTTTNDLIITILKQLRHFDKSIMTWDAVSVGQTCWMNQEVKSFCR